MIVGGASVVHHARTSVTPLAVAAIGVVPALAANFSYTDLSAPTVRGLSAPWIFRRCTAAQRPGGGHQQRHHATVGRHVFATYSACCS